jgi:hypothetical protein
VLEHVAAGAGGLDGDFAQQIFAHNSPIAGHHNRREG